MHCSDRSHLSRLEPLNDCGSASRTALHSAICHPHTVTHRPSQASQQSSQFPVTSIRFCSVPFIDIRLYFASSLITASAYYYCGTRLPSCTRTIVVLTQHTTPQPIISSISYPTHHSIFEHTLVLNECCAGRISHRILDHTVSLKSINNTTPTKLGISSLDFPRFNRTSQPRIAVHYGYRSAPVCSGVDLV